MLNFLLNLSLDGIGDTHIKVRRISHAFEKVIATAKLARKLGIPVQFQCTITPVNVYNIIRVREFAIENNYDISYRIASYIARLSNGNLSDKIRLSEKQSSFVSDFLESPRTIMATNSLGRRLFYSDLSKRLKTGSNRLAPCSFQSNALFLAPNQSIYNCSRSELKLEIENRDRIKESINSPKNQLILDDLISNTCQTCHHDQSGRWPLWKYFLVHKQFYYKINLFKKIIKIPTILKNLFLPISKKGLTLEKLKRVIIIGCYGGEHVGDAAILGGVILRLIKKYDTNKITILSIRPDRTKCWLQNLSIENIAIDVNDIKENINVAEYDALVLGGGPLMNIPILLSNHLSFIKRIKKISKPFLIEAIGIGPLGSFLTKQMIIKILKSADSITVRTERDQKHAQSLGLNVEKTKDAAFEYLNQLDLNNLNRKRPFHVY